MLWRRIICHSSAGEGRVAAAPSPEYRGRSPAFGAPALTHLLSFTTGNASIILSSVLRDANSASDAENMLYRLSLSS